MDISYPQYPSIFQFTGKNSFAISDYCGFRIVVNKTPRKREYSYEIYQMDEQYKRTTGVVIRHAGITFPKRNDAFKRAVAVIDALPTEETPA